MSESTISYIIFNQHVNLRLQMVATRIVIGMLNFIAGMDNFPYGDIIHF